MKSVIEVFRVVKEFHRISWVFRNRPEINCSFITPIRQHAYRFAVEESSEMLKAWMKATTNNYLRNPDPDKIIGNDASGIFKEATQFIFMLATALGPEMEIPGLATWKIIVPIGIDEICFDAAALNFFETGSDDGYEEGQGSFRENQINSTFLLMCKTSIMELDINGIHYIYDPLYWLPIILQEFEQRVISKKK